MEVVPREIAHEGEVLLQVRTSLTKQKASLHDTNTYILLIELPFPSSSTSMLLCFSMLIYLFKEWI